MSGIEWNMIKSIQSHSIFSLHFLPLQFSSNLECMEWNPTFYVSFRHQIIKKCEKCFPLHFIQLILNPNGTRGTGYMCGACTKFSNQIPSKLEYGKLVFCKVHVVEYSTEGKAEKVKYMLYSMLVCSWIGLSKRDTRPIQGGFNELWVFLKWTKKSCFNINC